MDSGFSYPIDAMITVASNVQKEIAATLPQHNHTIMMMTNLEGLFPGNVEATFTEHIRSWAQNTQACYDALNALANQLNQGSQVMTETDQNTSRGFNRFNGN